MSRRRQQRRADKARRHLPIHGPSTRVEQWPAAAEPRVIVREAGHVDRLAYTRSQAAEALGISRSTLRRLLPFIETIELPWGTSLIPVDELERVAVERRRTARPRLEPATRGRKHGRPTRDREAHPRGALRGQKPPPDRRKPQRRRDTTRARWRPVVALHRARDPAEGRAIDEL